jgi:hypothetical protein
MARRAETTLSGSYVALSTSALLITISPATERKKETVVRWTSASLIPFFAPSEIIEHINGANFYIPRTVFAAILGNEAKLDVISWWNWQKRCPSPPTIRRQTR